MKTRKKQLILNQTIVFFLILQFSLSGKATQTEKAFSQISRIKDIVFPETDWVIKSPKSQAIDEKKLEKALTYLEKNCGRDGISQTVIIRNGYMIWQGEDIDSVHNVWSCTKSFTSTILGLLQEDGKISLDEKVVNYIPKLENQYSTITFRHFATMTSGYTGKGDWETTGHGQTKTPFIPDKPLFASGTEFRYWDSAMNVFGYALTKVANRALEDIFLDEIADPIGMKSNEWKWGDWGEIDEIKINGGAGNKSKGVHISAREMAKFGYLLLNKGNWGGKQLISENWVELASSIQVKPPITQYSKGTLGIGSYGFNWWLHQRWPDSPIGTFAATGYNNNMCFIIPKWDMVIVRLGMDGNINDEVWNTFFKKMYTAFQEVAPN